MKAKQTQSPDLSAWCDLKSSHTLQAQQRPAGLTVEGILNKSNFAGSSSSHKLNFLVAWGWCIFYDIILRKGCGSGYFVKRWLFIWRHCGLGSSAHGNWHSLQKQSQLTPAEVLAHQILNACTSLTPQYQMLWCLHQTVNYMWAASKQKFF